MNRILALPLIIIAFAGRGHAQQPVFIANPSVAESALASDDVKGILLGNKTKWEAGNIKLVVLSEGALHEKVIQSYAQRSADQFDKYWKKQVFTGKGMAPVVAKTDAEVVDYVAKNPGAFGYITAGATPTGVKTLVVK